MGSLELGPFSYMLVASTFGDLSIVWWEIEAGPKVYRVFLPDAETSAEDVVQMNFPGASLLSCPEVAELGERMQRFLEGEAVELGMGFLALERYSEFQRSVLVAEHKIPRGWVSTYGRIAKSLGTPRAARAVGNSLARNPFPIIVPCHRTIRADGRLGGFRGGVEMKRALLEMEGVEFNEMGKVLPDRVYY